MSKITEKPKGSRRTEKSAKLWQDRLKFVPKAPYHYSKIAIESAEGCTIRDVDGNEYIDFTGGIGVLNVGHSHPAVVKAVKEAADKFTHISFHVCTYESYIRLAERLTQLAPGKFAKKAIFFNSGAEAVENAVKAAKAFTKRTDVIAFDLGFHGRTYMAVSLTGKEDPYRKGFGPFMPGIYHSPYPYPYRTPKGVKPEQLTEYCLAELERLLSTRTSPDKVAAIIVESFQGEGGFIAPDPAFLQGIRAICDKHGIIMIDDEIQAGMGRTGKMWACDHAGVVPDLMTVAKSLGGGMPLSAVVGRGDVLEAVQEGGMGGTYGGNPISCAAALAVLDIYEKENLVARGQKQGKLLQARFDSWVEKYPYIGDSRGLGPMRGIELVKDKKTKEPISYEKAVWMLNACAERGLLILKAGLYNNVIRTMAPLVATEDELNKGCDILESVIKDLKL
jgi:4-aminobutyrate aminotransferase/(S)-3-amino-2-methylpropionate transaminase